VWLVDEEPLSEPHQIFHDTMHHTHPPRSYLSLRLELPASPTGVEKKVENISRVQHNKGPAGEAQKANKQTNRYAEDQGAIDPKPNQAKPSQAKPSPTWSFNQCLIFFSSGVGELPFWLLFLSRSLWMLADPAETSATELTGNLYSPLTSRPSSPLLPLASACNLNPTPTPTPTPTTRYALCHYCARSNFPSPPLAHSASPKLEKSRSSLSPLLSAPHIDPHSPSPEHTQIALDDRLRQL
jgi:hypothetical protein